MRTKDEVRNWRVVISAKGSWSVVWAKNDVVLSELDCR